MTFTYQCKYLLLLSFEESGPPSRRTLFKSAALNAPEIKTERFPEYVEPDMEQYEREIQERFMKSKPPPTDEETRRVIARIEAIEEGGEDASRALHIPQPAKKDQAIAPPPSKDNEEEHAATSKLHEDLQLLGTRGLEARKARETPWKKMRPKEDDADTISELDLNESRT